MQPSHSFKGRLEGEVTLLAVRRLLGPDATSFRSVRLSGLRIHPEAFGASWEEEADWPIAETAAALESGFVVGCEREGVLLGVAGLSKSKSLKTRHRGVLWGMQVEPQERRSGIGRRLLSAIFEEARTSLEDLTLTVGAENQPAIALYRQFGFVEYGLHPRALKINGTYVDEILMQATLQ